MNENTQKWTPSARQEGAIVALLKTPSLEQAAKTAKVSRSAIYQWLREDHNFTTELRTRRREAFESDMLALKAMLSAAVGELARLIASKNERTRLTAVKTALDCAFQAHETLDVEDRLSVLERQAASRRA